MKPKGRILFITAHRIGRAPNQRFRFEQYVPILQRHGFECVICPLIETPEEDKVFYTAGNRLKKIFLGLILFLRRFRALRDVRNFDLVFIIREAFVTGSIFFEKRIFRSGVKIIYDFDDSIWLDVISPNNRFFSRLKSGEKTGKIIGMADIVFAGNAYLAAYARKFNPHVTIVPTTIDTTFHEPGPSRNKNDKIIIGWSGSESTVQHFQFALPALKILKKKYGESISFTVLGSSLYKNEALGIQGKAWQLETELQELRSFDIGIMPLPDDEWSKGKCGLKGLLYMAVGIPCIMSPVGVNTEIIHDSINGFLAGSTEEWVDKLSILIENPDLRKQIGVEGRNTVVRHYSVESQMQHYLHQIEGLLEK